MTPLDRLKYLAESWGGYLIEVTPSEFAELNAADQLSEAPFTSGIGVDFDTKTVYYTPSTSISSLIHEMGHVFASHARPEDSEELDFFGWEFVLAKTLGVEEEWLDDQVHYSVPSQGGYSSFRRLPLGDQTNLLESVILRGRLLGIIVGDTPVAVR